MSFDTKFHQIISSYFIGPKAENLEFFKRNVNRIFDELRDTRLNYHKSDKVILYLHSLYTQFLERKRRFKAQSFWTKHCAIPSTDSGNRDSLQMKFETPNHSKMLPKISKTLWQQRRVCLANTASLSGLLGTRDTCVLILPPPVSSATL